MNVLINLEKLRLRDYGFLLRTLDGNESKWPKGHKFAIHIHKGPQYSMGGGLLGFEETYWGSGATPEEAYEAASSQVPGSH